jgi:hypothetical protein
MPTVYEYAVCLLVALGSGTLLFTLGAMGVMLWTAGGITWRWSRELALAPSKPLVRLPEVIRAP